MRSKLLVAATGATIVLAGSSVVYATAQPDQRPQASYAGEAPSPGDRPESEPTGGTRLSAVRGDLAILERSRSANDRVSPAVAQSPLLTDNPADLAEARQIRRPGTSSAWIAPGSNGETVCLIAPGELTCPPAGEIADRGLSVSTFWHATGPVRVTGIASEHVRSVDIVAADGTVSTVPIVDSSFLYESERAAREVRWNGPNGLEVQPLPPVLGRE